LEQKDALQEPDWGEKYLDGSVRKELFDAFLREIPRDDPLLIQVIQELGESASGMFASLRIVSIPNGISFHIEDYDGKEWVAEDHHTWS